MWAEKQSRRARLRWGTTPISDIDARSVELWLKGLDLKPKTKGHLRSLLSCLIDYAMWAKVIPVGTNPMSLVRIPGSSKRSRKPRSLTVEEFHRLIHELREPFRTIALVCVCLGLRISEAMGLRWSDIDWLQSTLTVQRAIVERHVDATKTENSSATFALTKELLQTLQLWRQITSFASDDDWIFASPVKIGRLPYCYTGVWRVLKEAAQKADLGWIATHTFRHTYRAWMGFVGTDVEVQQKAMRHTDVRMTMAYGDIVDGRIDQALEKLSGLVFANSTRDSTQGL